MKNSDFTNEIAVATLTRLAKTPEDPAMALRARASFVVAFNLKMLTAATEIYNQKREELVNKYSKKDEKGELIRPDKDGVPDTTRVILTDEVAFYKELKELLDVEPEVKITKLKPEALEEAKLSPAEMLSIMWMLDGE